MPFFWSPSVSRSLKGVSLEEGLTRARTMNPSSQPRALMSLVRVYNLASVMMVDMARKVHVRITSFLPLLTSSYSILAHGISVCVCVCIFPWELNRNPFYPLKDVPTGQRYPEFSHEKKPKADCHLFMKEGQPSRPFSPPSIEFSPISLMLSWAKKKRAHIPSVLDFYFVYHPVGPRGIKPPGA